MSFLRSVARVLLPGGTKARMRRQAWELVQPHWQLRSGLSVTLHSKSEWDVYNDIFVDGEYDVPINDVLDQAELGKPVQYLDLGANVGLFTLRFADLALKRGRPPIDYRGTLVEGSPRNYRQLTEHLEQPLLKNKLRLFNGLVGERTGHAKIGESVHLHGMNAVGSRGDVGRADVNYLDLTQLFGQGDSIALMKCDIEGSELTFLRNYRDWLPKVRRAVFELHTHLCDVDECIRILAEAGLKNRRQLWSRPEHGTDTDYFWQ